MMLKLPMLSLVEEFKFGKVQIFQMLHDSRNPLVKNTQPSVITSQKWKAKIAVENAELASKIKEIIGKWKSKPRLSSTTLVVQGIHNKQKKWFWKKFVRHFTIAIGQRK